MVTCFAAKTPLSRHCCTLLKGQSVPLLPPPKTLTMAEMNTRPGKPKRPTCPACSKPTWLCLCARIKTKPLDNSIAVTVLQHSLEKKHPLNSVRIASLGLKNVAVSTVSDVNFEARFSVRLLESESEMGFKLESDIIGVQSNRNQFGILGFEAEDSDDEQCDEKKLRNLVYVKSFGEKKLPNLANTSCVEIGSDQNQFGRLGFDENCGLLVNVNVKSFGAEDSDKECDEKKLPNLSENEMVCVDVTSSDADDSGCNKHIFEQCGEKKLLNLCSKRGNERDVMCFSIGKQGVISSLDHIWADQNSPETPSFDAILRNQTARRTLARGFAVQKLRKREREGSSELEELMEFELEVPPGSVLLFPRDEALSIEGLKAIGFEVKNLVVLDGTWAKAKRMYAENPWLRLLPHLKLEMEKVSLYNGVRMQPKAGCLSTIESIVYALKALGDQNLEGLDDLLDVFDSMVSDQRQCKEKRLRNASTL